LKVLEKTVSEEKFFKRNLSTRKKEMPMAAMFAN
jgi:hypothetical protein